LVDTGGLQSEIATKLSSLGDQANTEFLISKLLPSSQDVELVGQTPNRKLVMLQNLLRPNLKCKNPRALCVVAILDILCFKSLYEVKSSNECILSHMCTVYGEEVGDNNTVTPRVRHFCCKGFAIDILMNLERDLEFEAEIYLVEDKKYGVYDKKLKRWNGMIGDLVDGRAELALRPPCLLLFC
ncbi:predicted protein, partial [Nematostella vectensis]